MIKKVSRSGSAYVNTSGVNAYIPKKVYEAYCKHNNIDFNIIEKLDTVVTFDHELNKIVITLDADVE